MVNSILQFGKEANNVFHLLPPSQSFFSPMSSISLFSLNTLSLSLPPSLPIPFCEIPAVHLIPIWPDV